LNLLGKGRIAMSKLLGISLIAALSMVSFSSFADNCNEGASHIVRTALLKSQITEDEAELAMAQIEEEGVVLAEGGECRMHSSDRRTYLSWYNAAVPSTIARVTLSRESQAATQNERSAPRRPKHPHTFEVDGFGKALRAIIGAPQS
jgi:hypothetical protein